MELNDFIKEGQKAHENMDIHQQNIQINKIWKQITKID